MNRLTNTNPQIAMDSKINGKWQMPVTTHLSYQVHYEAGNTLLVEIKCLEDGFHISLNESVSSKYPKMIVTVKDLT